MELKDIMNSPGLWGGAAVMMAALLGSCVFFLRAGLQRADELKMDKSKIVAGVRSASITTIGPALACVVVLLSFLNIFGAPTTWMRLNDVGAARSELGVSAIAAGLLGQTPGATGFDAQGFTYSLWGMALNNFGWLFVTLILTSRMGKIVDGLNSKFDPKLINMAMQGAVFGLFGYLLVNAAYGKGSAYYAAAAASAIAMFLLSKFVKNQRLQELSLGIAMVVGMVVATALYYAGVVTIPAA